MGSAYAGFFGGIAAIVISLVEGIVAGVFVGMALMTFSGVMIYIGRKHGI
jgi:hypothetical protein